VNASTRRLRHPAQAVEFDTWSTTARQRLADLLVVPDPPAEVELHTSEAGPRAEITSATLETGADAVPCWLLVPPAERRLEAAVVALAGHGRGIDALIDDADDYHTGFALKLAAAGFTVLCPELRSFGRRRTPEAITSGPAQSSCQVDASRGLLTGRPILGNRVTDARAAVRALATLPWVDESRIAVMGGSGGGAVALLAAALDQHIAAAVVGTYFSSFAASFCSVPHCICNSVPDLLTWFEMTDIAALIAPRPLIIEAGEQDPIFPIAATRAGHADLVELWQGLGAVPPRLIVTDCAHQFTADQAIEALVSALRPSTSSGHVATSSGHVATSSGRIATSSGHDSTPIAYEL
jgi:dienelactone hydrolase